MKIPTKSPHQPSIWMPVNKEIKEEIKQIKIDNKIKYEDILSIIEK